MTICAIHQPNFLPWLPYFDKIKSVDTFIFLDDVDYPKSGNSMGSWCNRVKISVHGEERWFSCPVIRESGKQKIKDVKINKTLFNVDKLLSLLNCDYLGSVNYEKIIHLIREGFNKDFVYLADLNIFYIKNIAEYLGIKTHFIRQSDISMYGYSSNEMLINLCKQVEAQYYLSGNGAKNYMDEEKFAHSEIDIIYQVNNYSGENLNYSILHYLFNNELREWSNFNAKK